MSPTKAARNRFVHRLAVSPDDDGQNWLLLEPFSWTGPDDHIEIPAGFVTDFASIPRPLWSLYPPTGRWGRAAVVHDWLYRRQTRSRAEADAIFLEGMRALGVPLARRLVIYLSVRLFGWAAWRSNARKRRG